MDYSILEVFVKPITGQVEDLISEIRKIKHPYDRGIKAREGIEF